MPRKMRGGDTEHERAIDNLIPKVDKIVAGRMKKFGIRYESREGAMGKDYKHCFRTQFFHEEINKQAFKAGLRSWK
jgi:hypothetical protein